MKTSGCLVPLVMLVLLGQATSETMEEYRLPKNVQPTSYKLRILTYLSNNFTYNGEEWIDIDVMSTTNKITLHSKDLLIFENETRVTTAHGEDQTSQVQKRDLRFANLRRLALRERKPYAKSVETSSTETADPELPVVTTDTPVSSEVTSEDDPMVKKLISTTQDPIQPTESSPGETTVGEGVSSSSVEPEPLEETKLNDPTIFEEKDEDQNQVDGGELETEDNDKEEDVPVVENVKQEPISSSTTETLSVDTSTVSSTTEAPTTTSTTVSTTTLAATTPASTTVTPSTTTTTPLTTTSELPTSPEQEDEEVPGDIQITEHQYDIERDFLTLQLDRSLKPGKYRLFLKYRGVLKDSLTGFHRVAYLKKSSKRNTWIASTVFTPTEARTAFPCFDEPEYKSTFDITLGHYKKFTALSNMPLKETEPIEDKQGFFWDTFERTPRMSTYLVAFLISDMESIPSRSTVKEADRNVTYKFWARHDVLQKARYSARIAQEMKVYLEDLLEVKDPLPKHDFVALPSFVSGALENWGLNSFAERYLLSTPSISSLLSKYEITKTLAHEISHNWFGNIVTPRWWDQIWLSEGFANYFATKAADKVQPAWDVETLSLVLSYLKVFSLDAMYTSHPLVPELKHPSDLNEIFDSISYQKGYYLIRMLNYSLGEDTFMKSVRQYLKSNELSNVDEDDLWRVMNEQTRRDQALPDGFDIKEIMTAWTREPGFPVLDIDRDYEEGTANITQRRFLRPKEDTELRRNENVTDSSGTKWWIPVTYTSQSEADFGTTKPQLWLKPSDDVTMLSDMPSDKEWILVNKHAAGMYRVNYDSKNWELLVNHLLYDNYTHIPVINRVQIIDDLLDFARAGEIHYDVALDATSYLRREKDYLPWKAALSNFGFVSRMLRSTDSNRAFKKFIRNLVTPRFDELGFEPKKDESFFDSLNRQQIVKWACQTGHRQCVRKSIALFKKWTEQKKPDEVNSIPSGLRSAVYCTAIEHGGVKEWQFLWQRYLSNFIVTDKSAILSALGCSRNTRTLKKYLDWSIKQNSGIKKQDSAAVFKAVVKNDVGFDLARSFFVDKFEDINNYIGSNPFHFPQLLEALAGKMNKPEHLGELEAVDSRHSSHLRSVGRTMRQATERVKFNIGWIENYYQPISDWLKKQK